MMLVGMIYNFHTPQPTQWDLCPVGGGGVNQEETTPIRNQNPASNVARKQNTLQYNRASAIPNKYIIHYCV